MLLDGFGVVTGVVRVGFRVYFTRSSVDIFVCSTDGCVSGSIGLGWTFAEIVDFGV